MEKKILITGAGGMLGTDLGAVLEKAGYGVVGYARDQLDVCHLLSVKNCLASEQPEYVIHTAAATNVDECQRQPDLGYAVNTVGTWNVALACLEANAVIIYVSSCGVFDGSKAEPYTEFDCPAPLTHYHRSKYQAELIVAKHCPKHFIVRPGWLFGGDITHRRNFIEARRREALCKPELFSAKDKFGSPTYTVDFAEQVLYLLQSGAYGTYHVANDGFASRYEYVSEIIKCLALPTKVLPVGSDAFPRAAPVPAWEALDNYCLRLRGLLKMRPWQQALEDYISNRLLAAINDDNNKVIR